MKLVRVRYVFCNVCKVNRHKPVDMVEFRADINDALILRLCRQCLKHAASILKRPRRNK
jgi:hypothetical protein